MTPTDVDPEAIAEALTGRPSPQSDAPVLVLAPEVRLAHWWAAREGIRRTRLVTVLGTGDLYRLRGYRGVSLWVLRAHRHQRDADVVAALDEIGLSLPGLSIREQVLP